MAVGSCSRVSASTEMFRPLRALLAYVQVLHTYLLRPSTEFRYSHGVAFHAQANSRSPRAQSIGLSQPQHFGLLEAVDSEQFDYAAPVPYTPHPQFSGFLDCSNLDKLLHMISDWGPTSSRVGCYFICAKFCLAITKA